MSDRQFQPERLDLREQLAALCHEQWSGWMRYLFKQCWPDDEQGGMVIPKEFVKRWKKQAKTAYAELSTDEQESDLKEADRFLSLLQQSTSERCGGCGHERKWYDEKTEMCQRPRYVDPYNQVECGCKCGFSVTGTPPVAGDSIDRKGLVEWLAHRCDYSPPCGRCAYCRVANFVRTIAATGASEEAQPRCVYCNGAISQHRESGKWIHAVTGLLTCRASPGSKHDGINHATPPAPSAAEYCSDCSKAGDAEQPIYHAPPICAPTTGPAEAPCNHERELGKKVLGCFDCYPPSTPAAREPCPDPRDHGTLCQRCEHLQRITTTDHHTERGEGEVKNLDELHEPQIEITSPHVLLTEDEFLRMQAIEGRARAKLEQLRQRTDVENREHYIDVLKLVLAIGD